MSTNVNQLDDSLLINQLDAITCDAGFSHGMDNNPYNIKDEPTGVTTQRLPHDNVKELYAACDITGGMFKAQKKHFHPHNSPQNINHTNSKDLFFDAHNTYVKKRTSNSLFTNNPLKEDIDDILIKEGWQYPESDSWGVASFISGEVNTLFPKIKKLEMSIQIDNPVKEGTIYETRTYTFSNP